MKELIKGELHPYYEFGMEGRFEYTFVPDSDPQAVNGGRGYFLKSGDFLRILGDNGDIVWEGKLRFVPSKTSRLIFPDRHRLGNSVWATSKQKGVSYADWVGWFWATPRLQGEFFPHDGYK